MRRVADGVEDEGVRRRLLKLAEEWEAMALQRAGAGAKPGA